MHRTLSETRNQAGIKPTRAAGAISDNQCPQGLTTLAPQANRARCFEHNDGSLCPVHCSVRVLAGRLWTSWPPRAVLCPSGCWPGLLRTVVKTPIRSEAAVQCCNPLTHARACLDITLLGLPFGGWWHLPCVG